MFVQQLVNGLMLGGAYALVAIGYTLIFGVLNLLHLAHGDIFMVGAYVGLALTLVGFPPWATLGGAMLAAAALRSEEHTSELQSRLHLVCRLLLEKKKQPANEDAGGNNITLRADGTRGIV